MRVYILKRLYYPSNYYFTPKTSMNLLLWCLTFPLSTTENAFADKITQYWISSQSACYLSFDKDVRHFKLRWNFMLTLVLHAKKNLKKAKTNNQNHILVSGNEIKITFWHLICFNQLFFSHMNLVMMKHLRRPQSWRYTTFFLLAK